MDPVHGDSGFGLRRIVALAAALLGVLSAAVAVSLVVLTTSLHDASAVLRDTVSEVRVARQVQVDLLLLEREEDPAERARLENKLHNPLREADERVMSSEATQAARHDANKKIERYLGETHGRGPLTAEAELSAALASIDALVRFNVEDAERASAGAASLDRLGDAIGATAAVLMLAVPALLVWWIRGSVVRPMLGLSDAMDRFGKGDLTVRAKPGGASELQRMIEQFNAMGDALRQQHEARLAHLAGVAHDLRNPLAALQMSTAIVDARGAPLDESTARAFAIVRRQVGRLGRMVDDLLDATRIEAGQLALVMQETDLRAVVRDAVELFEGTSSRHQLVVELPPEPLIVRCDEMRIEQTLTNLLSNAIKYSPRGGAVRVLVRSEYGTASVSIQDEGVGIPESDQARIWEPFTRTGMSTESVPGVGLGLWTAKKLISAHDGTLSVASAKGKGSTFTLKLPLSASHTIAQPVAGALDPVLGHG
ncbi:MAG: Chemotaxis protein methyltransferase CheR [Labilithrix sp.]|nr:Chemotaxis protein methyltransferase CheR [Labilithrix sp.]